MPTRRQYFTAPELNAGDLDRRVTLLKPVYGDEFEDEITDWTPIADVWAAIHPVTSPEQNEAGRAVAVLTIPIVIRYRSDIDARWRIRDTADHDYEILAIADVARRRVQLQLTCREVD